MNDILEKLKANWMLIVAAVAVYFIFGSKKGGTRSRTRRRVKRMTRRTYGRMRRMRTR